VSKAYAPFAKGRFAKITSLPDSFSQILDTENRMDRSLLDRNLPTDQALNRPTSNEYLDFN
jgi:hypothetical protein